MAYAMTVRHQELRIQVPLDVGQILRPPSQPKLWGRAVLAKVAVARKLGVLMHRLWVTGEVYEPIGYQASGKVERPAA